MRSLFAVNPALKLLRLMVIIFGWGRGEAQDRGEVVPTVCPNCHNQVYLHEIQSQ